MSAEVDSGPEIYRPSLFWTDLARRNADQLSSAGFGRFKRTINQNYFNWLITRPQDPQFRALLKGWLRHPTPAVLSARLIDGEGVEVGENRLQILRSRHSRAAYAAFVALLWERARQRDQLGLLDQLSEPQLGSPILIRHRGREISQDLANSTLEFYSILDAFPGGIPEGATVVELGGGYGRLGWLLMSVMPTIRYIAVDIPPALAVGQEYLTSLFPDREAARFRRGVDGLEAAVLSSRMGFLTPNQLAVLPSLDADLFINISSLHEMRLDQIANYLDLVDRHTNGVFYTKQWRDWMNPRDGVRIRQEDYPILPSWQPIYQRIPEVQTHFFEAAYRIRPSL